MSTNEPDFKNATVPKDKILGYLLNFHHLPGTAKARYFSAFGFQRENWSALAESLKRHAQKGFLAKVTTSVYGTKFEIHGNLETPDNRNPMICSVWQLDKDSLEPRLITAYPLN